MERSVWHGFCKGDRRGGSGKKFASKNDLGDSNWAYMLARSLQGVGCIKFGQYAKFA